MDLGVVALLVAVLAEVTNLLAVAAGDSSGIARLSAFLRHVAFLFAVATLHDALLSTLLGPMAFLSTVATDVGLLGWTVLDEVSHYWKVST